MLNLFPLFLAEVSKMQSRGIKIPPTSAVALKQKSKALVEGVFELIKRALESGDDALISGFGKFSARKKAPRRGRNPATGDDMPRAAL